MKTVSKNKKALVKTLVVAIALLTSSVTNASPAALTAVGKKAKQERMMSPGYLQNGRLQKLLLQTKTGECMKQIPWLKKALLNDDVIDSVSYDVGGGRFEITILPAFSEYDSMHIPLTECFHTFNQEFEVETPSQRSYGKLVHF